MTAPKPVLILTTVAGVHKTSAEGMRVAAPGAFSPATGRPRGRLAVCLVASATLLAVSACGSAPATGTSGSHPPTAGVRLPGPGAGADGDGAAQATPSAASAVVTPSSVDFGPVRIGDVATRTVSVANAGHGDLFISGLSIFGVSAGASFALVQGGGCWDAWRQFGLGNRALAAIHPGSSCDFWVSFAPSVLGPHSSTWGFTTTAPSLPRAAVPVVGTGV